MKIFWSCFIKMFLIGALQASVEAESFYLKEITSLNQRAMELADAANNISTDKKIKKWAMDFKKNREKEQVELTKLKILPGPGMTLQTAPAPAKALSEKTIMEDLIKNREDAIVLTSKSLPDLKNEDLHHQALKMVKQEGQDIDKLQRLMSSLKH